MIQHPRGELATAIEHLQEKGAVSSGSIHRLEQAEVGVERHPTERIARGAIEVDDLAVRSVIWGHREADQSVQALVRARVAERLAIAVGLT
jgi:hypothetical protein